MAEGDPLDPVDVTGVRAGLEPWLLALSERLDVDRERRRPIVDEIRSHVLDAADAYARRGHDREEAMRRAIRDLGPADRLAAELDAAHAGDSTLEALRVVAVPVLLALIVRCGVLSLDGRCGDWTRLAATGPFALLAACALVGPALALRRERVALASWSAFWALTVLLLVVA